MADTYDYRNCQSLFGYALEVHKRHNCKCQICGCGGNQTSDFDIWRQMSVEHIIGQSQGGYKAEIQKSINERFPDLPEKARQDLVERINVENAVSACRFCNSMTSRHINGNSMHKLIFDAAGDPEEIVNQVIVELHKILQVKKDHAKCKIEAVRIAFLERVVCSSK